MITEQQIQRHDNFIATVKARSKLLFDTIKTNNILACTDLYEPVAIVECPEKSLLVGRADITAFWRSFDTVARKNYQFNDVELLSVENESYQCRSHWRINESTAIVSVETWTRQQRENYQIVQQKLLRMPVI